MRGRYKSILNFLLGQVMTSEILYKINNNAYVKKQTTDVDINHMRAISRKAWSNGLRGAKTVQVNEVTSLYLPSKSVKPLYKTYYTQTTFEPVGFFYISPYKSPKIDWTNTIVLLTQHIDVTQPRHIICPLYSKNNYYWVIWKSVLK